MNEKNKKHLLGISLNKLIYRFIGVSIIVLVGFRVRLNCTRDPSGTWKLSITPQTAEAVDRSASMTLSGQNLPNIANLNPNRVTPPSVSSLRTRRDSFLTSRSSPAMGRPALRLINLRQQGGVTVEALRNRFEETNFFDRMAGTSEEGPTGLFYQGFPTDFVAQGSENSIYFPLDPISVKEAKDLQNLTHNDVINLNTSGINNLQEKNKLLFPKVRKAINASLLEKMSSLNHELGTEIKGFFDCNLQARVFGDPISIKDSEEGIEIKFKITPRGSGTRYDPTKRILKGRAASIFDSKNPIFINYPYNPMTGKQGVTRVKHVFQKVDYDIDHLHVRCVKESLGQITAADDHGRTDICEARAVGSIFHTERGKFKEPERDPKFTYETEDGLFSVLGKKHFAFEEHIVSAYSDPKRATALGLSMEDYQKEFLESETLEETLNGYRQLYFQKIIEIGNRSTEYRKNGLLIVDFKYAGDCIHYKLEDAHNKALTSWRFIQRTMIEDKVPANLSTYVQETSLKGLKLCSQHLSFMKDALSMIDPMTDIGRSMKNQYETVRDQVKNQGRGLLQNLTTNIDQDIDELINGFINPQSFLNDSMSDSQKYERLDGTAGFLNCRGLETKEHKHLFPEYIPWNKINQSFKNCTGRGVNPEEFHFEWIRARNRKLQKTLQEDLLGIQLGLVHQFSVKSEPDSALSLSTYSSTELSSSSFDESDDNGGSGHSSSQTTPKGSTSSSENPLGDQKNPVAQRGNTDSVTLKEKSGQSSKEKSGRNQRNTIDYPSSSNKQETVTSTHKNFSEQNQLPLQDNQDIQHVPVLTYLEESSSSSTKIVPKEETGSFSASQETLSIDKTLSDKIAKNSETSKKYKFTTKLSFCGFGRPSCFTSKVK